MNQQALLKLIEADISRRVSALSGNPESLYSPIKYIMKPGGKRIRPLLVIAGYLLYRRDPEAVLPAASAAELFHNFTLIHDDLMDSAPLRRGEPTVHAKWDANTAILSGDAMLVIAYQWLHELGQNLPAVIQAFNKGALEVCEGQQLDMLFERAEEVTVEQYLHMVSLKTGALLGTCLAMGALAAGQGEKEAKALENYGLLQGQAFQLMDDLLDAFGNASFGKKNGGDILAGKKTWLMLRSMETDPVATSKAFKLKGEERLHAVKEVFHKLDIKVQAEREVSRLAERADDYLVQASGDKQVSEQIREYFHSLSHRTT